MGSLILREMRSRFGRRQLGYFWSIIEPAMYGGIAVVWFLLSNRVAQVDMPQVLFLLTGATPWFFFYRLDQFIRFAITRNTGLLYHPAISPFYLILGRFFLEIPTGIFFIGLVFVLYRIGMNDPRAYPVNWPPVLAAIALDAWLAFGIGGSIATILIRYEGLGWSLGFAVRIIFMTSGVHFVPDYAPPQWQPIIFWNPMTHIVMLFRMGFSSGYPAHHLNVPYTIVCLLILTLLCMVLERFWGRKWVETAS
jgi:capsular polysaccharide transport system permease protein